MSSHHSSVTIGGDMPLSIKKSRATINGLASGLNFLSSSVTTVSIPRDDDIATASARGGDCLSTVSRSTLCQIGSISRRSSVISRATRPFNSRCGQRLRKKLRLSTTIPKRHSDNPRSIASRRLSPIVRANSSYQTSRWASRSRSASGRTKSSLSSLAWQMKTSCSKDR